MSTASLDRLLAVLLAAIGLTGLASLWAGSAATAALFVAHGLLGGALLVASLEKLRRSLPAVRRRSPGRGVVSVLFAVLVLASVAAGFAAVASGRIVVGGPWTLLSWHAVIGVALLPLVALHLLPRRWRVIEPHRPLGARLSRRVLLAAAGLAVAGVAGRAVADGLDRAAGGSRRFTGSRMIDGSGPPPPTTFLGESTRPLDPATWRLAVTGKVATPMSLDLSSLGQLPTETRRVVLDCTSGWAHEGDWTGVPLSALLDAARPRRDATRVAIRAVTGWSTVLWLDDVAGALLATAVNGQPLPHGNGAPCRLVLSEHRGLEWVKWVDRIEVT